MKSSPRQQTIRIVLQTTPEQAIAAPLFGAQKAAPPPSKAKY